MINCPSPGELQTYADGEMARTEAAVLGRHIDGCPACQAIMGEIAESDLLIGGLFSREPIPVAPPFSLPVSAARPRWIWLSTVILALATLVSYLAWRQISALWLMFQENIWLAARAVLHNTLERLASQFPELIIQLVSGRLWNEQLLMQGIVHGLVIITMIVFFYWLKSQPRSRRQPV